MLLFIASFLYSRHFKALYQLSNFSSRGIMFIATVSTIEIWQPITGEKIDVSCLIADSSINSASFLLILSLIDWTQRVVSFTTLNR